MLRLSRPTKPMACCCWLGNVCGHIVTIETDDGQAIGFVKQKYLNKIFSWLDILLIFHRSTLLKSKFDLLDENMNQILSIVGPAKLKANQLTKDSEFKVNYIHKNFLLLF